MQKIMSLVALFAISISTQSVCAVPAVGFQSLLSSTVTYDKHPHYNYNGFLEAALVDFNPATQEYLRIVRAYSESGSFVVDDWVPTESLLKSEDYYRKLLENCESRGGVKETITVPAGTFETCKILNEQKEFVWSGVVPFGTVRREKNDEGTHSEQNLLSYSWGQLK